MRAETSTGFKDKLAAGSSRGNSFTGSTVTVNQPVRHSGSHGYDPPRPVDCPVVTQSGQGEKLPFTPFHMGAALIVKPALNRRFSVITFGIAQVAMDLEPGIRMAAGTDTLHGPTHTIPGALVVAFLVMLISPSICSALLTKWNREVVFYKQLWLANPGSVSKTAVIMGACFGTLSHVVLDSLMHHDIHPLSPFSQTNPFMGLITHDGVYQACTIAGVLGIATWLFSQWARRTPQEKGEQRGD